MNFLEPMRKPKSHLNWQFPRIWQILWRTILESLYVNITQIRNKWDCWESSAQTLGRDICGTVAIRSGREIHARRLSAKEVSTPMSGDKFIFPRNSQKLWRRSTSEDNHLNPRPERGEEQEVSRGESDGLSSPTLLQDESTLDDWEAKNDFWSVTGDLIYRHHVKPRVKLYMPKEESFPVPLKYIRRYQNHSHVTRCIVGKTYWWLLERGSGSENIHLYPGRPDRGEE